MKDVSFAELISKIAHELRSPLTSVKGFSATLIKRWDRFTDEQRRQFVATIHADAERMGRIISELLDLARLEAGRFEMNRFDVPLADVARKAAEAVEELEGSERIAIDIEPGLSAWGDPERLAHVLTNLLENAVRFSDDGAIRVSASSSDGEVHIEISDEGVGISEDRLDEVFSGPGPKGQRSGPRGTGLGLYLTRKLVEVHGGRVAVVSEIDKGSTFTVSLPTAERAESE